jgi:hypothetical protein
VCLSQVLEPEYVPLEDLIPDFQRTSLSRWDDEVEYHPGPPEPGEELYGAF